MNSVKISALIAATSLAVSGIFVASSATALPNPSCLNFDSASQSTTTGLMQCDVPAGVTSLDVTVIGAGGAGGGGVRSSFGGNGAQVVVSLAVTPGETLTLEVGMGGLAPSPSSRAQGGGGGGWSAIKRGSTPLVIAGAGGGGGSAASGTLLGAGVPITGGDGGQVGSPGFPNILGSVASGDWAYPGGGGTSSITANGGGGATTGGSGASGVGGNGSEPCGTGGSTGGNTYNRGVASGSCYGSYESTGGGGGAGYFGGGGGGAAYGGLIAGASGGGGSSYVASGTAIFSVSTNGGATATSGGNGRIQLAGTVSSTPAAPSTPALANTGSQQFSVAQLALMIMILGASFSVIGLRISSALMKKDNE